MQKDKTAWIAFLGNPHLDSRVTNLTSSLEEKGYSIRVTSFDFQQKNFQPVKGSISIFPLERKKSSFLFYLNFALILCRELRKSSACIYFAEDIYTLPFVVFYAVLKKAKVIYNCRELFSSLWGRQRRKFSLFILKSVERIFIRKCSLVLTAGELDTHYIEKTYSLSNVITLRNTPAYTIPANIPNLRTALNIPAGKTILLYQGVVASGSGITKIFKALAEIPEAALLILGDGLQKNSFCSAAEELGISDRVYFYGMVNHNELLNYTAAADIGLALIENISFNYYYALPNRLFEYIMAGVPVIASSLPQMKEIIDKYKTGVCIDAEKEEEVISAIKSMIASPFELKSYKENCFEAAKELNWQIEFGKLSGYL